MSNICIIPSCNTRRSPYKNKTDTIKCFSFPKDPDQKKLWLQLCQVNDDHNRKVCVKHFKEDDFVDGMKARLMCVQPTRLKKDAVPSLFLSTEKVSEEVKQKQIQNQEEMLQKYICKDKAPVIDIKTNPTNKRSMEYLSKLIPIAPKVQPVKKGTIIAQKSKMLIAKPKDKNITIPKEKLLSLKKQISSKETSKPPKERIIAPKSAPISSKVPLLQQWPNITMKQPNPIKRTKNKTEKGNANLSNQQNSKQLPKTVTLTQEYKSEQLNESEHNIVYQVQAGLPFYQNKILQHDNAIYKKRIDTLVETQNILRAKIKNLEAEVESQKGDFICKVKEAFAHVLTANQIDNILGKKKRIWWSDDEYSKALELLHISKQAYKYVRDIMNYPIPHVENVHKWSIKHGLKKLQQDKNNQNNDENKENSCADDDQMIHDVDIKGEIRIEVDNTGDETEKCNQMLDKDFIKTNNLNIYQYSIAYETDHENQGDKSMDQENETNHVNDNDKLTNNNSDQLEHDHDGTMNEVCQTDDKPEDQQETDVTIDDGNSVIYDNGDGEDYYEELIIDNDYSDDEVLCDQNEFTGKDNG